MLNVPRLNSNRVPRVLLDKIDLDHITAWEIGGICRTGWKVGAPVVTSEALADALTRLKHFLYLALYQ